MTYEPCNNSDIDVIGMILNKITDCVVALKVLRYCFIQVDHTVRQSIWEQKSYMTTVGHEMSPKLRTTTTITPRSAAMSGGRYQRQTWPGMGLGIQESKSFDRLLIKISVLICVMEILAHSQYESMLSSTALVHRRSS